MDVNKGPSVEETQFGCPSPSQRKRVLHFASGETLEEDSSDEEDETRSGVHSSPVNTVSLSSHGRCILSFCGCNFARSHYRTIALNCGLLHVLTACDYLGEKLASLAGLNTPKYQYAVDEYHRKNKEGSGLEQRRCLSSQGNTDYGSMGSAGGAVHLVSERSAGLRAEESANAAHLRHGR